MPALASAGKMPALPVVPPLRRTDDNAQTLGD